MLLTATIQPTFYPANRPRPPSLAPLFAPNRVLQADAGVSEDPPRHFLEPKSCVEAASTSQHAGKIVAQPPVTGSLGDSHEAAERSCLARAGVPSLYPHQREALALLSSGQRVFQNVQTGGGRSRKKSASEAFGALLSKTRGAEGLRFRTLQLRVDVMKLRSMVLWFYRRTGADAPERSCTIVGDGRRRREDARRCAGDKSTRARCRRGGGGRGGGGRGGGVICQARRRLRSRDQPGRHER